METKELSNAEMAERLERTIEFFESQAEWIEEMVETLYLYDISVVVVLDVVEGNYRFEIDSGTEDELLDWHSFSVDPEVIARSVVAFIRQEREGGDE